jgi:hypothetical protein
MTTDQLIPAKAFCASHQIELSFIQSLHESGLIEITIIEQDSFVHTDQLEQLEKIIRWHYDMDINIEGIETITHLLEQMNSMQHEIAGLKNKLHLYEPD